MVTRQESYDLSARNTFGMKVSCRLYVEVTEPEDLLTLDFAALPKPLFVMGGGSNLLFTGDFPGTVLHMANRGMRFLDSACGSARNDKRNADTPKAEGNASLISTQSEGNVLVISPKAEGNVLVVSTKAEGRVEKSIRVRVAAGVVFDDFCAWAAAEGLWGPENLSLIPGEVGASAVQNIGAYGVEAKDIIDTVHAFDLTARTFVDIPCADCAYGYRASRFKTEWKGRFIITAVTFRLSAVPQPKLDYGGVRKALEARFLDSAYGSARNDKRNVVTTKAEGNAPVISTKAEGRVEKSVRIRVAAGVVFDDFCAWAAAEGLWGPENLSLIPGEVGASAVQNIGAYGVEAKDIIDTVHAFDLTTRTFVDIPCADCAYGYRTSRFKTEWKGRFIISAVTFRLSAVPQPKLDYGGVRKALEDVVMPDLIGHLTPQMVRETVIGIREQKLPDPAKIGSAGSFFCNPVIDREHFERIVAIAKAENGPAYEVPHYDVGGRVKVPAAWMIDQCGFKGAREGGAQVYPRQPLVIVNATGSATPEEIITLERRIIDTIREKYGIELHPEVEHIAAQEI